MSICLGNIMATSESIQAGTFMGKTRERPMGKILERPFWQGHSLPDKDQPPVPLECVSKAAISIKQPWKAPAPPYCPLHHHLQDSIPCGQGHPELNKLTVQPCMLWISWISMDHGESQRKPSFPIAEHEASIEIVHRPSLKLHSS